MSLRNESNQSNLLIFPVVQPLTGVTAPPLPASCRQETTQAESFDDHTPGRVAGLDRVYQAIVHFKAQEDSDGASKPQNVSQQGHSLLIPRQLLSHRKRLWPPTSTSWHISIRSIDILYSHICFVDFTPKGEMKTKIYPLVVPRRKCGMTCAAYLPGLD